MAQLTAGEIQFQSLPVTFQQTELKLFMPQESKLAEEYAKFISLADLSLERGQAFRPSKITSAFSHPELQSRRSSTK